MQEMSYIIITLLRLLAGKWKRDEKKKTQETEKNKRKKERKKEGKKKKEKKERKKERNNVWVNERKQKRIMKKKWDYEMNNKIL